MENEILRNIKEEYEEMVKVFEGDNSRLEELITNITVQSYIALEELRKQYMISDRDTSSLNAQISGLSNNPLVKMYKLLKEVSDDRYLYSSKDHIICDIVRRYAFGKIKSTNGIWCYLHEGTPDYFDIEPEYYGEIKDGEDAFLYQNIEDFYKCIAVSKNKLSEFESTHQTVYGKANIYDSSDIYFNTKFWFFKDCINEGQEEAIRKVLEKKMR